MNKIFLIKYGELSLKKANKKAFIKQLVNNIKTKLSDIECDIKYNYSRIFIECSDKDEKKVENVLSKTFGIYSYSIVYKCNKDLDDIIDTLIKNLPNINTFKFETRRSDKNFYLNSMEISSKLGALLLSKTNLKVDVNNPDKIFYVEVREDYAYLYFDMKKALGGYPVGVQNKALVMLSGGIDSPVASFLTLKKGIAIDLVYFESLPHTSLAARQKVIDLANKISEYGFNIKLFIVNFTTIQETIYKNASPDYGVTLMRRAMYRISEKITKKYKHMILVNGESIGQVASQTLTSMRTIESVINIPVVRPLACFDKEEIIKISKDIDTYDISIRPYEDCCTLFVPTHPVINPNINKCEEIEAKYDYLKLEEEAVNNLLILNIPKKEDYKDLL